MYSEYQIITDYSLKHLESSILSLMKEGWQPIGGVSMVPYINNPDGYKNEDYDTIMYAQAVVR